MFSTKIPTKKEKENNFILQVAVHLILEFVFLFGPIVGAGEMVVSEMVMLPFAFLRMVYANNRSK